MLPMNAIYTVNQNQSFKLHTKTKIKVNENPTMKSKNIFLLYGLFAGNIWLDKKKMFFDYYIQRQKGKKKKIWTETKIVNKSQRWIQT